MTDEEEATAILYGRTGCPGEAVGAHGFQKEELTRALDASDDERVVARPSRTGHQPGRVGGELVLGTDDESVEGELDRRTGDALVGFGRHESETLLRCALEIATYARQLDQAKFREDFMNQLEEFRVSSAHFKSAVLFDRSCLAYKEFMDLPQRPKLQQLLVKLKVSPFFFDLPVIESVSVQPPNTPTGCP